MNTERIEFSEREKKDSEFYRKLNFQTILKVTTMITVCP